jgi:site-specific DNA recombinase
VPSISRRASRLVARTKLQSDAKAAIATTAVAYLRVSTEEQASTGHGLEAQERAVRAFAESQGYELVDVLSDPGISGATRPAGRPGFARVLELAGAKRFSVLLVHKIDRLARDIRHAVTTVSELAEEHDVAFRSVAESVIDTANPMGRTFFAIFAGMAENERHVIADRTKGGRVSKAMKGGFAGGRAPYGYRRDLAGGLVVVDDEAKVVRRILDMRRPRARGRRKPKPLHTLRAVADALNAEGIPSPKGNLWRPGGVAYVADNAKYEGDVEYVFTGAGGATVVRERGTHEAIAA